MTPTVVVKEPVGVGGRFLLLVFFSLIHGYSGVRELEYSGLPPSMLYRGPTWLG